MIYLGFILAVAILFYAINQKVKHEKWHDMYWDENRLHQDTSIQLEEVRNDLSKWVDSYKALSEERIKDLTDLECAHSELNDLTNKIELLEESLREKDSDSEVTGTFVQHRQLKRPTPETYRVVFDLDINGQRILEHLTQMHCRDAFDLNSDRKTSFNLGQQSVVNFIINQINQANDPNYQEVDNNG